MQTAIRVQTTVLPGKRIEIVAPELQEGDTVEVILLLPNQTPTLREILAPFRQQVEESGISDKELDALFEAAREEVWQKQK